MSRSLKKGPFIDKKLLIKVNKVKSGEIKPPIKTWSRDSVIHPEMVGITFKVHNGKDFTDVKISEEMIGFRLGEFSPTRKFRRHGLKVQKELESKQGVKASN
mgnify:CR=1 FL=1